MICFKALFFFFLFIGPLAKGWCLPSASKTSQDLVGIASQIQKQEAQLSMLEDELNQARVQENMLREEIRFCNQQLMQTIHYLRHAKQYSPLLAMLSVEKPENIIHSSLLLRFLTPKIQMHNKQLFEKIKQSENLRRELEEKKAKLRDVTFQHYQDRNNLDVLLKKRSDTSLSEDIVEKKPTDILNIISPVMGKIIPTYGNMTPEWAPYTQGVLVVTRSEAQVVSPLSGIIAFAGDYAPNQGKMVIVETPHSHVVLSGLDSLTCYEKQAIKIGEPLGRMCKITKNSVKSDQPKLYLEIWHQEQTIDPQSILKLKMEK